VDLLQQISDSLQCGEHTEVAELTDRAVASGLSAAQILDGGLLAGMDVVGRRFGAHEIFLPEVLLAARAMKAGVDRLRPLLVADKVPSRGTVVLGTVKGDLHDIGKNLVAIMLQGAGFEVIDLGTDVTAGRFVEVVETTEAQVVGMSALLTTTMAGMRDVVAEIRAAGLAERVKVVVGGAPVTQRFADEIGADAYGYDAANAVEVVKRLTGVT
jgi:5-methyltetrahydrofolate--homocysteine methyltransferase